MSSCQNVKGGREKWVWYHSRRRFSSSVPARPLWPRARLLLADAAVDRRVDAAPVSLQGLAQLSLRLQRALEGAHLTPRATDGGDKDDDAHH